jgi:hypothetical protein
MEVEMTERKALGLFIGLATLVAVVAMKGLAFLGADSETQASVLGLLLSAAGLGGGFLFLRYH